MHGFLNVKATIPQRLMIWSRLKQTPFSQLRDRFKEWIPLSASTDYPKWQRRFMAGRIRLMALLAMAVLGVSALLNLLVVIPALNASGNPAYTVTPDTIHACLLKLLVQELGLLLGVFLLRYSIVRRDYTSAVFLWCSWSILLLPQLQSFLKGELSFNPTGWIIVYMAQAILIPVRWRLHLLSQVTTLGVFVLATLAGFSDPDLARDPDFSASMMGAFYTIIGVYTVMVCFISDLGVYLYERMLKREFDLRRQLRLFLHAVSHDLRNPVLGTMMVLKNLRNPAGDAKLPQVMLERMIESGDRQIQLIDSLLEAHTVETQGIQLNCQMTSVLTMAQTALADLTPFIQEYRATVQLAVAEDLPLVWADPMQIHRVYENLILNVLRNNPAGLELRLDARVVGDRVRCTIDDNGCGLSSQQCEQLFDLYARGPHARQTLGVGLGLYICQQIVEAHRGDIGVSSCPGRGSSFWFDLAIAPQPARLFKLLQSSPPPSPEF